MDKSVELNGLEHGYIALFSLLSFAKSFSSDHTVYEVRIAIYNDIKDNNYGDNKSLRNYNNIYQGNIWLSIIDDYLAIGSQLDNVDKLRQWLFDSCKELIKDCENEHS